jgi:hypothetical protein
MRYREITAMKRDLALSTLCRVLLCGTLFAALPASAIAQPVTPVFQSGQLDLVSQKLSAAHDDIVNAANASQDKCPGLAAAVAVLDAREILRQRYDGNNGVKDLSENLNIDRKLLNDYCGQVTVVPPIADGLGGGGVVWIPAMGVGGGGSVSIPPVVLAYLYLTKDQREAFESHLVPQARSALRSWLDDNGALRDKISTVLSEEMKPSVTFQPLYSSWRILERASPVLPLIEVPESQLQKRPSSSSPR